jgi:tRNA pseudouridine38-40 synthase
VRAFRLAYDGRPFYGFQRQPSVPTVEGALLDALADLGVTDDPEATPPGYAAAGRTDAGVSARAQTVGFVAPDWLGPAALNSALPAAVRAWARADAPDGFHATHDAARRAYVYHLHAPDADDAAVEAAAARLAGRHDFHNLTPDGTGTERDLSLGVTRDGEFLVVRAAADGFARQLVRRLVSVLAAAGRGEAGPARLSRLLGPDPVDGPAGVAPAPPEPLVLAAVDYPALSFVVDETAAASAREALGARRVAAASAARALGTAVDGV